MFNGKAATLFIRSSPAERTLTHVRLLSASSGSSNAHTNDASAGGSFESNAAYADRGAGPDRWYLATNDCMLNLFGSGNNMQPEQPASNMEQAKLNASVCAPM